jgi:uncharacterized protein (TIGR02270 family)
MAAYGLVLNSMPDRAFSEIFLAANSPLSSLISQHTEGASFLWILRGGAVAAPHYSLADLAKLDNRVEANLDGLRIAGDAGWEISKEALSTEEPGEVFAASVLAFESGKKDRLDTVLQAGTASLELSRALVSALGWLSFEQAEPHIKELLASSSSTLRRVGLAASAIHRQNPGAPLVDAISGADPLPRSRALQAVGEFGLRNLLYELQKYLADQDERCRFWAAWSSALLSADSKAMAILGSIAESALPYREKALQLVIRRMDASAARVWREKLAQDAKSLRIAIIAAGAFGDPASVPWLIDQMKPPELARVAGEAFTMITGVDISYEDLDGEKPDGFEAGPTESAEDDNVEMDPDENLPWPNPELIAKSWNLHQAAFEKGGRYLLGKPISVDWCRQVLRSGRQRQRAAAALELATREPGQPLFNVAAPGFRQKQLLGLGR